MEDEEDWFDLFDYIEQLFSSRGLTALIADEEKTYRDRVIETMRLLYIDLRNTDRSTAKAALELLAENVDQQVETDHFTIGPADLDEPSELNRRIDLENLPDNSFLQNIIRQFVLNLGGPDFGNDPDGGYSPGGGGGGPSPFGGFIFEPSFSRTRTEAETLGSGYAYDQADGLENSDEENQQQFITQFGSGT